MLNVLIYRGPMDTTMDTKLSPLKPFCAGHSSSTPIANGPIRISMLRSFSILLKGFLSEL
jgi:hypothetical protein